MTFWHDPKFKLTNENASWALPPPPLKDISQEDESNKIECEFTTLQMLADKHNIDTDGDYQIPMKDTCATLTATLSAVWLFSEASQTEKNVSYIN